MPSYRCRTNFYGAHLRFLQGANKEKIRRKHPYQNARARTKVGENQKIVRHWLEGIYMEGRGPRYQLQSFPNSHKSPLAVV
jgi:hypothetical protein